MVCVLSPGPPKVSSTAWSNSFRASMVRMTTAMTMAGFRSGNWTRRKICQRLAPMTRAALISSGGRAEKPDRKMRNVNEVHCQTSARMIAHCAARGCDSQRMRAVRPKGVRNGDRIWLRGPEST